MPHAAGLVGRAVRHITGRSLLVLAMLGAHTSSLRAQRPAQLRAGLTVPTSTDARPATVSLRIEQPTHWKAGLIIGTLVGAFAIYHVGVVGIDSFTPRVGLGLLLFGGLVGGVPGALIGDQFPKGPPDTGPPSSAFLRR